MAQLLTALHAAHPRLELDVSYDDSVVDLLAERFDAAIRIGNLPDSTLVARRVAPVSLIAELAALAVTLTECHPLITVPVDV